MTFENIIKEVRAGNYSPIYFLHGEEPYYIDKIANFIETNVLTEAEKAFNQVVIYGKDADFKSIVDEARQFPMMSNFRVIIIREAQDLKTLTELTSYLEKPSATSIVVFCYKYKKLDKRTKFSKLLDAKAVVFESKKIYDNQVAAWARDYFKSVGLQHDNGVTEMLAEYLGADLSKISNEIDKLSLNNPKDKSVNLEDIKEQIGISKDFDIFELQNMLGEKNFSKAAMIIHYFSQNMSANPLIMITSSVFGYFNRVMTIKYHLSKSDSELAKATGVNTFFLKDYKLAAKNYTMDQLKSIIQVLKNCDKASKGIGYRSPDEGSVLKDLLIACMQP